MTPTYALVYSRSEPFVHLQGVKNVLSQAYADATQVTDELVDCILQPGLQVSLVPHCTSVSEKDHQDTGIECCHDAAQTTLPMSMTLLLCLLSVVM